MARLRHFEHTSPPLGPPKERDPLAQLLAHVERGDRLCIVQAPPGSGKTFLLVEGVKRALQCGRGVAVAGQTNSQCDDICARLVGAGVPATSVWRFLAGAASLAPELAGRVSSTASGVDLPDEPCVVVATTAKWGLVQKFPDFDFLFVDEAWQMGWADFMLLGKIAGRFVLIGDPGQIPPVVTVEVGRWETARVPPHRPAPEVIAAQGIDHLSLRLPMSRRLAYESTRLVRPFYDFEFDSEARPGERYVRLATVRDSRTRRDAVLDLLGEGVTAAFTLPTDRLGPPVGADEELAFEAVQIALRMLERKAVGKADAAEPGAIQPADIGMAAIHRVMNSAIMRYLPEKLRDPVSGIRVDTPERWQGLERKCMIIVYPLSGVLRPSVFELETGRLCVMASRHRCALTLVSRSHVHGMLQEYIPMAQQALGLPDVAGRGHASHLGFWDALTANKAVVAAS